VLTYGVPGRFSSVPGSISGIDYGRAVRIVRAGLRLMMGRMGECAARGQSNQAKARFGAQVRYRFYTEYRRHGARMKKG